MRIHHNTCTRNALIQAFRLAVKKPASPGAIPEFLAPALLAPPSRRPYSTNRPGISKPNSLSRRPEVSWRPSHPPAPATWYPWMLRPEASISHDIRQWLVYLDLFLPKHLRRSPAGVHADLGIPESYATDTGLEESLILPGSEIADFLLDAETASHDLISHLGLREQRWDVVAWLVDRLALYRTQEKEENTVDIQYFNLSAGVRWPKDYSTLDELIDNRFQLLPEGPRRRLARTLDNVTGRPPSFEYSHRLVKHAFGQVWRSLGRMVLAAAESDNRQTESDIMTHVLRIIANLHHRSIIPESVYRPTPDGQSFAFQQPPTLQLLATPIFTALSDATWRAQEASEGGADRKMNASYFMGREIPGSRFDVPTTQVTPEVWLELILWSCLHGGWVLDGAMLLEETLHHSTPPGSWKLICWREILAQSEKSETAPAAKSWGGFWSSRKEAIKPDHRQMTHKTVSAEVVAAFIDALISTVRVGVGPRGIAPETILQHIKSLKNALDKQNLSLGCASWTSIITRMLETGGIDAQKRPDLLLQLLELSSGFGEEVGSLNASNSTETKEQAPYFFLASAAPVGLSHVALKYYIETGDIDGLIDTVSHLQHFTDNNKRQSLREFYARYKKLPLGKEYDFSNSFAPIEFPGFDSQIPLPLLAEMLELVTETGMADFGRWLLFSQDVDGPLIAPWMYRDRAISVAMVRFAHTIGDEDLIMEVVRTVAKPDKDGRPRLPAEILTALMVNQVRAHRWDKVRAMRSYIAEDEDVRPRAEVVATFAAEMLQFPKTAPQSERGKAISAFTLFLRAWEDRILNCVGAELLTILGILFHLDSQSWKIFLAKFVPSYGRHPISLRTRDFNHVLDGIVRSYGSLDGKRTVEGWCSGAHAHELLAYSAPGGVPQIHWVDPGESIVNRPKDIEINFAKPEEKLVLYGRIRPNKQTILTVLRRALVEENQRQETGAVLTDERREELREILQWGAGMLYKLGVDYDMIVKDWGALAASIQIKLTPPRSDRIGDGNQILA